MGVKDLYELGGVAPVAFKCDQCGHVWNNDRDAAWCCGPVSCEACSRVIEKTASGDYDGICWDCRKAHLAKEDVARELERYQNAAKLPWDQRTEVLMLPNGQFWRDGDGPIEFDYAWTCSEDRVEIGADIIIDAMLDDFEQDSETVGTEAVRELQLFVDGWISRHLADVSAHLPDLGRCVLVHLREATRVCVGRAEDCLDWAPYCTMDGPCDLCGTFCRTSLDLRVVNQDVDGVYCNRICANSCAWTPCTEPVGCEGVTWTDRVGTWTSSVPLLIDGGVDDEGPYKIYNPLLGECVPDVSSPCRKGGDTNPCDRKGG